MSLHEGLLYIMWFSSAVHQQCLWTMDSSWHAIQ